MGGITRLNPIPIPWAIWHTQGKTNFQADQTVFVWKAPFACQVVDVGYAVITTAIAKHTQNALGINLYNAGTDGTGTSAMGTISSKTNTLAWTANTPKALTAAGTAAWLKLGAGDTVTVKADVTATIAIEGIRGAFSVVFGHEN